MQNQRTKTSLTLRQQFRKNAVEKKSSAFRVWKSRMKSIGHSVDELEYIINGYDNVRKELK